jgi:hypothetical protein
MVTFFSFGLTSSSFRSLHLKAPPLPEFHSKFEGPKEGISNADEMMPIAQTTWNILWTWEEANT